MFDVAVIADYESLLQRSPAEISSWREAGGQVFLDETALRSAAESLAVALAPRIETGESLPVDLLEASQFLKRHMPKTLVALDEQAGMRPEGLVVRSPDRSAIAKLRFEDYERTLAALSLRESPSAPLGWPGVWAQVQGSVSGPGTSESRFRG